MDWPRVCSLLAHELRSPSAVIAGYARMLGEGRLSGDDQAQVYVQIERAAARITTISAQASELSRWLNAAPEATSPLLCSALLAEAIERCGSPERVTADSSQAAPTLWIPVRDPRALALALATAIDAVVREAPGAAVVVSPRVDEATVTCDILIGPSPALSTIIRAPRPLRLTEWLADRGGQGLALVVSAAVVMAHGGELLAIEGRRDMVAIRLHLPREAA